MSPILLDSSWYGYYNFNFHLRNISLHFSISSSGAQLCLNILISPFRDTSGSRASLLQDDRDLISSIATEDGDDGVPRTNEPSHGTMGFGHPEVEQV